MKIASLCFIAFIPFAFNLSKAMHNNDLHTQRSAQDSIYTVWKLKKIEIAPDFRSGMGLIDKYDTWDLTKKGILSYSVADSPAVFHAIPYELINNAIILQFPDKQVDDAQYKTGYIQLKTGDVQYKIKELTLTELKVIMHVRLNYEGEIHEFDTVELDFNPKE